MKIWIKEHSLLLAGILAGGVVLLLAILILSAQSARSNAQQEHDAAATALKKAQHPPAAALSPASVANAKKAVPAPLSAPQIQQIAQSSAPNGVQVGAAKVVSIPPTPGQTWQHQQFMVKATGPAPAILTLADRLQSRTIIKKDGTVIGPGPALAVVDIVWKGNQATLQILSTVTAG